MVELSKKQVKKIAEILSRLDKSVERKNLLITTSSILNILLIALLIGKSSKVESSVKEEKTTGQDNSDEGRYIPKKEEALARKVADYGREKKVLEEENDKLKQEIVELLQKNHK